MKVEYSLRAQSDIGEIFAYISAQDTGTAMAVEGDIRCACQLLASFPYTNSKTDLANVYRMPLPRRGLTVFYRVKREASIVQIIRVVRSSRVRNLGRVPSG
jgi:plasmid stabilization system protein ParE